MRAQSRQNHLGRHRLVDPAVLAFRNYYTVSGVRHRTPRPGSPSHRTGSAKLRIDLGGGAQESSVFYPMRSKREARAAQTFHQRGSQGANLKT